MSFDLDKMIPSFEDGVLPGEEWIYSFLRRYKKEISQRNCNPINQTRGSLDSKEFEEYMKGPHRRIYLIMMRPT